MKPDAQRNVVLFPKTVEYYQIQLTRLLEGEKYAEAYELLHFLLQCNVGDEQALKEWGALYVWLGETLGISGEGNREESEEVTEGDLLKMAVQEKMSADGDYGRKLLAVLKGQDPPEKKMLALEQLAYVDQPEMTDELIGWLQRETAHPLLRFKALQTLKLRGMTGSVTVSAGERTLSLQVEKTPLGRKEFPGPIHEVAQKVREKSEINDPTLAYFAEQAWYDFVIFIYGFEVYDALAQADDRAVRLWACALHLAVLENTQGTVPEEEICALYGIGASLRLSLDPYRNLLRSFFYPGFFFPKA